MMKIGSSRPMQSALPRLQALTLATCAAASLMATACLQTNPDSPAIEEQKSLEDNGRKAGASSSTNWPPGELVGGTIFNAHLKTGNRLVIRFTDLPPRLPLVEVPAFRSGTLRLFPAKAIPSLDSVPFRSLEFRASDSIEVELEKLDALSDGKDTLMFNLQLDMDTLQGWFTGFMYERKSRRITETANPASSIDTVILRNPKFYFQGSTQTVTSMLPPSPGKNPQVSFYIPGTPNSAVAKPDSFKVGPLPKGEYPLRVIRLSQSETNQSSTLVEAWELKVTGNAESSVFSLGEQVLSTQAKGKLTLRDE